MAKNMASGLLVTIFLSHRHTLKLFTREGVYHIYKVIENAKLGRLDTQGIPTGRARLSSVDLLIKVGCFVT
jgi:hypothetical protein